MTRTLPTWLSTSFSRASARPRSTSSDPARRDRQHPSGNLHAVDVRRPPDHRGPGRREAARRGPAQDDCLPGASGAGATLVLVGSKMPVQMISAARKSGHVIEVEKGKRKDLLPLGQAAGRRQGSAHVGRLDERPGRRGGGAAAGAVAGAWRSSAWRCLPGSRITPKEIAAQFRGQADVKLFGFIDAVAQKQGAAALEAMHYLMAQGEAPSMLFWNLTRHFRQLLEAAESSPKLVAKFAGQAGVAGREVVPPGKGFRGRGPGRGLPGARRCGLEGQEQRGARRADA